MRPRKKTKPTTYYSVDAAYELGIPLSALYNCRQALQLPLLQGKWTPWQLRAVDALLDKVSELDVIPQEVPQDVIEKILSEIP